MPVLVDGGHALQERLGGHAQGRRGLHASGNRLGDPQGEVVAHGRSQARRPEQERAGGAVVVGGHARHVERLRVRLQPVRHGELDRDRRAQPGALA